jgi:hypothetical protein
MKLNVNIFISLSFEIVVRQELHFQYTGNFILIFISINLDFTLLLCAVEVRCKIRIFKNMTHGHGNPLLATALTAICRCFQE